MKLSSDISNAKGSYPYKYKQVEMRRLENWQAKAAQLEAELVLYKKVTAMPKLLWDLQAKNERLKELLYKAYGMEWTEDALKEKP